MTDESPKDKEPGSTEGTPKTWTWRWVRVALGILSAIIISALTATHTALELPDQWRHVFGHAPASSGQMTGPTDGADSTPPPNRCVRQGLMVIPGRFLSDLRRPIPVLMIVLWTVNVDGGDVTVTTMSISHFEVLAGDRSVEIFNGITEARLRVIGPHSEQEYQIEQPLAAYLSAFSALPSSAEFVGRFDVDVIGRRGNMPIEYSCRSMIVMGTVYRG
jgi:hypothetical protein